MGQLVGILASPVVQEAGLILDREGRMVYSGASKSVRLKSLPTNNSGSRWSRA